ncbi:MAG: cation:proton antiporter [Dysgonamonadaceae bacterium]|jgi:CPA2 family monovalent cation:H+ antiporter-2|nr:cation:proton antiporter [Dysgonamonadaceae bacterium]
MSHLPDLMKDLALILISAGIITLIFKWLKQPLVLGYIVAGILAGPYVHIFPTVTDTESVNIWAEIGVVFLLFALGLEFSFKKLMNVGGTALITATTEVISMLAVGYFVGMMLGWSQMDSIFLGGMLSMSSTTIIIKAFNDLGLRNQKFTGIVFGTLVVEDLVAILMMVLLSTMAVTRDFAGEAMLGSILKVIFFLILWFLIGIYILPVFFKKARKLMNDETLLIISIGLCLGMVVLATKTGFSAALGAFIMGSILAETIEAEHIEHIIKPVKDLFGAIFFVSVGMLVDPAILVEYVWPVVIITLVTIIGKAFFSSLGVLLSGQTLKTSVQSGFSLAQIGEFAFIIASLGVALGVMNEFIYPIVVAVSVITTFTTPYMIRLSEPFAVWLYRILPDRTKEFLNTCTSGSKTVNHESDWKKLVKNYIGKMIIYIVLLAAIVLFSLGYLSPFLADKMPGISGVVLSAAVTLACMAPFLIALIANKTNSPELFMSLWNDNKYNRGRLLFLVLFRVFIAVSAITFVLIRLFNFGYIWGIIIALAVLILILVFRRDLNQYNKLETNFLNNLNQREEAEKSRHPLKASFNSRLNDKNIHISTIVVSPDSLCVGKTLKELNFRNDYGVSVIKITRGSHHIYIPGGSEYIYPQDKIAVVGTDEQICSFAEKIEMENTSQISQEPNKEVDLQSFTIDEHFPYMGMSILESEIGKNHNCLIVGIEREGESIMNPDQSTIFESGDLVWVVAEKNEILSINHKG